MTPKRILILSLCIGLPFMLLKGQSCDQLNITEKSEIASECTAMVMTMIHDNRNLPYLYIASKEAGLRIVDISNIEQPIPVASVPPTELGSLEVMNLFQEDNYLYLALGNHFTNPQAAGLGIVNITDPLEPMVMDYFQVPGTFSGSGMVKIEGNYAYLGAMRQGLVVFDISDKSHISQLSRIIPDINWPVNHPPNAGFYNARGLEVRNSIVYLCYDAGGIRIINCTNKEMPFESGRWCNPAMYTPFNFTRAYNNIVISSDLAYVAVDYCGMEILDISDTASIKMLGWWNPYNCPNNNWFTSPVHANELFLNEACGQVFLATGKSDMVVVDVSNPQFPDSCNYFGGVDNGMGTWGISGNGAEIYLSYICVPLSIPFASDWTGVKLLSYHLCNAGLGENNIFSISTFPNPAHDWLKIRLSSPVSTATITITDLYGRQVYCNNGFTGDELLLPTEHINPGVYLLEGKARNLNTTSKLVISPGN